MKAGMALDGRPAFFMSAVMIRVTIRLTLGCFMARKVAWFSCGAASAVAARLSKPDVLAYCETGGEHPDNARFLEDVERWVGVAVTRIKSEKYDSTWDLWERRRYLSGVNGATCTTELKVIPRIAFQRPTDIHVFGYTFDHADRKRADRLRENYPELTIETPLIDHELTKANVLALVDGAGIKLPPLYALGFQNNNCIPCVKATSPGYWALVRRHFPDEFARMATLSRELGVRLARIKNERVFIDEIPADQSTADPIAPSCDFLCHLIEQEMEEDA